VGIVSIELRGGEEHWWEKGDTVNSLVSKYWGGLTNQLGHNGKSEQKREFKIWNPKWGKTA